MNRSASARFDCLIIGSGVVATTMASLLVARGLVTPGRVAIVGDGLASASAEPTDWDLRVFALSRASQRLLDVCGVWSALPAQRMASYERMCVWDARGEPQGSGSLTFDCAELGEPNLGHIVEGRSLQLQCWLAAQRAGAVSISGGLDRIVTDDAGVHLRLLDGRELSGLLLIGADGSQSKTRDLLGIDTAGHAYAQDAVVAHVRTTKPHLNTAWQRFIDTGPLAFLPLPDGRSSIVWTVAPTEAARLLGLDPAAFDDALTVASGGVLGSCHVTTPVMRFPLKLQYALDYVKPHAALLGDAAHVVHPLAGQGLNLGLLDCASLVDVLSGSGADAFGEFKLLRRYERWRRSDNLLAAAALDALERLFGSHNSLVAQMRLLGLSTVARLPSIKRRLAERALGIGGDVPAFLREDPVSRHR